MRQHVLKLRCKQLANSRNKIVLFQLKWFVVLMVHFKLILVNFYF